ncbi:NT5C3B isoform 4 [Pongo abelii]|uniref:NT5C3B isoform 4 n=1 Tax=Pongo abelii TaxID=9601 RepID=A0A2J8RFD1_PONAB|nr:NT5C3B isoform 4 [Pongo abelii]
MAEEVSTLMKATVLMRQPGRVQEIVGALRKGGGDRLQISQYGHAASPNWTEGAHTST